MSDLAESEQRVLDVVRSAERAGVGYGRFLAVLREHTRAAVLAELEACLQRGQGYVSVRAGVSNEVAKRIAELREAG